ncbi:MAG: hypothetical protein ACRETL_13655, partial [Gammaproteobacteria bacterium]
RRLAEKAKNTKPNAVTRLIRTYPGHDFFIDNDEAKSIFVNVEAPADCLYALIDKLGDPVYVEQRVPLVRRIFHPSPAPQPANGDTARNAGTVAAERVSIAPSGGAKTRGKRTPAKGEKQPAPAARKTPKRRRAGKG